MNLLNELSKLIYDDDKICYGCGGICEDYSHICKSCRSLLKYHDRVLNVKMEFVDRAYSVVQYEGLVRELLHSYKYSKSSYLSVFFGNLLSEYILESGLLQDIDQLYFVPAHYKTTGRRAYNQCELLADYICERLKLPISKGNLVKVKASRDQIGLSGEERRNNLRDVFKVKDGSLIYNKRILLLDDIITTGTTMDRCGEVLKKNGCAELIALSITTTN